MVGRPSWATSLAAKHFRFARTGTNMTATIREAIMHGTSENKRGLRAAFRSLLGALLASSPGIASSVSAADEPPPMVLAKTGYFFVGGKIDASLPGSPMTGQMYVEYFIPKTLSHPLPIVMIH